MEIIDKVTFEHGSDVRHINIDGLIESLESNGIKIDPAISEKVVDYRLELRPNNLTYRKSFVPMWIDTQDLYVVSYILRSYDEKGRLRIELQNSQRGDALATCNVPNFQIKVESDAEHGMEIMNNVRKSLDDFSRKIYNWTR